MCSNHKDKMSVPCEMLLHPELLSNDQLRAILQERCLRIPNMSDMGRDLLLELFHHYCVPYGQRKYRDSGRGKLLNRNRNITEDTPSTLNMDFRDCNNMRVKNSHHSERLKPLPDLLSGHVKRIKVHLEVDKRQCRIECETGNKRKITANTVTTSEGPPKKKERKLVTWP